MECTEKRHPTRLIKNALYHVETEQLGCERPLLYLGYVGKKYHFLPVGWDPSTEGLHSSYRAFAEPSVRRDLILSRSHIPDGSQ